MKNGKHLPGSNEDLAKLLRANNALLVEQISHSISVEAILEVVQAYLPFAAAADEMPKQQRQMVLAKAIVASDKRLRKEAEKRIQKILRDASK